MSQGIERYTESAFNRRAGYRFLGEEGGWSVVTLEPREEHVQVEGLLHGGVIATLADTTGVYSILPELADGTTITSIEFKLNFLRPARLEDGALTARSRPLKTGRSVATAEAEVSQGGELVAKGLFTYLVLDRR